MPEGYSIPKCRDGCATNIGSEISLLVYQWPPYKSKNLVYKITIQSYVKWPPLEQRHILNIIQILTIYDCEEEKYIHEVK